MTQLAIHDPHYFNVESEQKTAIVHLFHNPIPADGPREEGPEWAREVDDIYLIGGVGPDGPTVKTVANGEATEWSAGAGTYKNITIHNSRTDAFALQFVVWIEGINDFSVKRISFAVNSEHVVNNCLIHGGALTLNVSGKPSMSFAYDNVPLDAVHHAIGNEDYYNIQLPANYNSEIPIIML